MHTLNRLFRDTGNHRKGATYLEIQVAMVMLAIGMSGLYSMSVVQSRQASRLTQSLPPDEVAVINQAPSQWARKLGAYGQIQDTLILADEVHPRGTSTTIVDNESPDALYYQDPSDTYGWTAWSTGLAYESTARYHVSVGLPGSYTQFSANGLTNGQYEVFITYPNFTTCGDVIPCEIYDDATLLDTIILDQTIAPSSITHLGRPWDSLGIYTVTNNSLRVRLNDGPGCETYIIADAIMVRPRRSLEVVSVAASAGGGATAVLEVAP